VTIDFLLVSKIDGKKNSSNLASFPSLISVLPVTFPLVLSPRKVKEMLQTGWCRYFRSHRIRKRTTEQHQKIPTTGFYGGSLLLIALNDAIANRYRDLTVMHPEINSASKNLVNLRYLQTIITIKL